MLIEKNGGVAARGLLASLLGLGPEECQAVRRHAGRMEARGDLEAAFEAYRVAALLEPDRPASWRGLERVLRVRGEEQAATGAGHIADLLEARKRGERWKPRRAARGGVR